jgi:hypothetical protein
MPPLAPVGEGHGDGPAVPGSVFQADGDGEGGAAIRPALGPGRVEGQEPGRGAGFPADDVDEVPLGRVVGADGGEGVRPPRLRVGDEEQEFGPGGGETQRPGAAPVRRRASRR